MMLATHAVAGAAVATLFPAHPAAGFAAGFASHFLLDSIPHWDYKLDSLEYRDDIGRIDMVLGRKFLRDLVKIGFDCAVGLALSLLLFARTPQGALLAVAGVAAGILPDALQFVYMKLKPKSLVALQRFHKSIQQDRRFQERPALGIPLQLFILAAVVAAHFLVAGRG